MLSKPTVATALFAATASAQLYPDQSNLNHTCLLQKPLLSCPEQDPTVVDSCCVETFGGLLLTTQFWSTYTGGESSGQLLPADTWTIHGMLLFFRSFYITPKLTATQACGPTSAMDHTRSTAT